MPGAKFTSSPRCEVYFVTPVRSLLCHLTADFAARIGCGVNVDVILAGHQVGGLFVVQRRAAFNRARARICDRNLDAGVRAGRGGALGMRARGGAPWSRKRHPPPPLLSF